MSANRARLLDIIKEYSFRTGDFTLTSGKKSSFYVDGKQTTLNPEGSALLAEAILDVCAGDEADAIGGMTLGADPMVGAAIALSHQRASPLRGFIVRKEIKEHGTSRQIEGPIREGDRVIIIEDTTTTGGSAFKAIEAAEAEGMEVVRVVTMVDRLEGAADAFAERGYTFSPIFTARDLGVEISE